MSTTRLDDEDRKLLQDLLEYYRTCSPLPSIEDFRIKHVNERQRIDKLLSAGYLQIFNNRYYLLVWGLIDLGFDDARKIYERCIEFVADLRTAYIEGKTRDWSVTEFANRFQRTPQEVSCVLTLLGIGPLFSGGRYDNKTGYLTDFMVGEWFLDLQFPPWIEMPDWDEGPIASKLAGIEVNGYRPFSGFSASPGQLTVIIGANGTGKSSLLDLLRLVAFAAERPLPPEIDPRSAGTLFHAGAPERMNIALDVDIGSVPLRYEVSIQGPVGNPRIIKERLAIRQALGHGQRDPFVFLELKEGVGFVQNSRAPGPREKWTTPPNELALRKALNPTLGIVPHFQSFLASWRFYSGFDVAPYAPIRRAAFTDQAPALAEDGSNLSAVLNSLYIENKEAWEELETLLHSAIPGFQSLGVRPRGKGMVIGVWREFGVKEELTLADLSDGSLRLLCWLTLSLSPNIGPLIGIDEPEVGLHPRVLPVLAGAFKVFSSRAQLLITTHSPYFLSQFSLDEIAVMRKDDGRAEFVRPSSSNALRNAVAEIGDEAIAKLFISDELEVLP